MWMGLGSSEQEAPPGIERQWTKTKCFGWNDKKNLIKCQFGALGSESQVSVDREKQK